MPGSGSKTTRGKIKGWSRFRKAKKTKSLTKKVKKLTQEVYNNKQNGWIDAAQLGYNVDSTGTIDMNFFNVQSIVGVGQGGQVADPTSRIGNKIVAKRLTMKFLITNSEADIYNVVRVIVFKIPDPESAPPAVTDILQFNASNASPESWYKKDSKTKYKILKDFTVNLQSPYSSVTQGPSTYPLTGQYYPYYRRITKSIDLKSTPIHFRSAVGGQPIRNAIGILLISDSSDGVLTGHPKLSLWTRFLFDP